VNELSLAVLFSRKFAVYTISVEEGSMTLVPQFEQAVTRNSFNFTYGSFGGAPHDKICVQSVDG